MELRGGWTFMYFVLFIVLFGFFLLYVWASAVGAGVGAASLLCVCVCALCDLQQHLHRHQYAHSTALCCRLTSAPHWASFATVCVCVCVGGCGWQLLTLYHRKALSMARRQLSPARVPRTRLRHQLLHQAWSSHRCAQVPHRWRHWCGSRAHTQGGGCTHVQEARKY